MKQIVLIGLCAALWFALWRALFGPQRPWLRSLWGFMRAHGFGLRNDVAHVPLSKWFVPFLVLFSLPVAKHFSGNTACNAGMDGSCALQAIALTVWMLTLAALTKLWSGPRLEPTPEEEDAMWSEAQRRLKLRKWSGFV